MSDTIELTLKSPLTKEQFNLIMDAEFEHTDRIWFDTPKGKHVEFVKAQQWIPVTERLPEEETDVLVCNVNGDIEISSGSYSTEMKDYFIWYTSGWRFGEPIAWMPLPEPYKEESEEVNG